MYLPLFLILRVREQRPREGKGIAQGYTELGLKPKLLTPGSTPTDAPRTSLKRPRPQAATPQEVRMAGGYQAWSFRRRASYSLPSTPKGTRTYCESWCTQGTCLAPGEGPPHSSPQAEACLGAVEASLLPGGRRKRYVRLRRPGEQRRAAEWQEGSWGEGLGAPRRQGLTE